MYSFPSLEPICCSMSISVASWPAYRFLRRQVRWSGILISLRIFHSCCDPHSQRLYNMVCEAEVNVFVWNSLAFSMIQQVLAIWSLIPLTFLNPAWTYGSSQFTYCWSQAWRILNITRVWDEWNCAVVWTFFGIAFLLDWNENWPFPVLWLEFSKVAGILSAALSQHHLLGFEIAQLELHHLH